MIKVQSTQDEKVFWLPCRAFDNYKSLSFFFLSLILIMFLHVFKQLYFISFFNHHFFNSQIYTFFSCSTYQDTKNPKLLVPVPKITEPLPPKKSNCREKPDDSAASERLLASTFALFFGSLCVVVAAIV